MTPEDQVAQILATKARLTLKPLHIGHALCRGEQVVMHIFVQLCEADRYAVPLHIVQRLRDSAAADVQARVVLASPLGVFVKKVEVAPIDGWIGLQGETLTVNFGRLVINGQVMDEEKDPLKQVADSKKEWFE